MRIFFTVFFMILSLQSFSRADNIKEIELDGMSLGTSLLNFTSENEIKKTVKNILINNNFSFWSSCMLYN